jgi:hypothetical protein
MKGIMFTELLGMMESRYSPALSDRVLVKSNLPHGGAYTSVARYPAEEWLNIVSNLSIETGVPGHELVRGFGEYLFGTFKIHYPELLSKATDTYSLLESVHGYIHVEVRKLYPDAELPAFSCSRPAPGTFLMDYSSPRPLADLAQGLIHGALTHFGEDAIVSREDAPGGPPFRSRFTLRRRA